MRRFLAFLFLATFLVATLTGCSKEDPWDPNPIVIPRTDLYVANFSAEEITEVYVVFAGNGEWGENWITSPIRPGNLFAFIGDILSGDYDIRMVGNVNTVEVFGFTCVSDYIAVSFNPAMPDSNSSR